MFFYYMMVILSSSFFSPILISLNVYIQLFESFLYFFTCDLDADFPTIWKISIICIELNICLEVDRSVRKMPHLPHAEKLKNEAKSKIVAALSFKWKLNDNTWSGLLSGYCFKNNSRPRSARSKPPSGKPALSGYCFKRFVYITW